MYVRIKKKELFPLLNCILFEAYYTMKGWKYNSNFVEIFLIMGILCGLLFIIQKLKVKTWRLIVLSPLVILVFYRASIGADTRLIVSVIAILVGMYEDFSKISVWLLKSKILVFLICFFIGGYAHKNYLAVNLGTIIFLFLYCYYPISRMKALFFAVILYGFAVIVSGSGAMIICAGFGLILYLGLETKVVKKILTLKIQILFFPIVLFLNWFFVAIYAAYSYSASDFLFIKGFIPKALSSSMLPFTISLNRLVSGRISLAAYSMIKFGISLWGGNIDYNIDTGLPYFLIDSGMMLLLQDWGIIITIAVMLLFVFLMYKLVKNRKYTLIISALVIALWAFSEDILLSVGANYMFYTIGRELNKATPKKKRGGKEHH